MDKAETIEEAFAELMKRGFDKVGALYHYMYPNGDLDKKDITDVSKLPAIKGREYIDCGRGYLWHSESKILHPGTIEYLKNSTYNVTTFKELLSKLKNNEQV